MINFGHRAIKSFGIVFGAAALLLVPGAAEARDSLGVYESWGAFRDPRVPRCYAIAQPRQVSSGKRFDAFASVGTWPRRKVRGQVHFRLSRKMSPAGTIRLTVGRESFELSGGGNDAWAQDERMDAAIVAAMRSASAMIVRARSAEGRLFSETYRLNGIASAIDAASVGCARLG